MGGILQGMPPKLAFFIFIYRPPTIIFIKTKVVGHHPKWETE
jgi:hypothetical protein